MSKPVTEAGKRLLDDYPARYGGALYTDPISRQLTEEAISAIEAEAVADDRLHRGWTAEERAEHEAHDEGLIAFEQARITAEVEGLPMGSGRFWTDGTMTTFTGDVWAYRAAVLAIVNRGAG